MREERNIFYTAIMFYSRIPTPKIKNYKDDYINKATRYFPFVGWIIGSLSFLLFLGLSFLFSVEITIALTLLFGVLLTGAFHEDGLADAFDGFGGGWTKTKILDIMKDSRIGTYGSVALIFLFLLKYLALKEVIVHYQESLFSLYVLFVSYHALARWTAANIIFISVYSREDELSKSKPIAKANTLKEKIGVYFFGILPFLFFVFTSWKYLFLFPLLILLFFLAKRYFEKWIDGYTGDCLGAVEQIAELLILLYFSVLWKLL